MVGPAQIRTEKLSRLERDALPLSYRAVEEGERVELSTEWVRRGSFQDCWLAS